VKQLLGFPRLSRPCAPTTVAAVAFASLLVDVSLAGFAIAFLDSMGLTAPCDCVQREMLGLTSPAAMILHMAQVQSALIKATATEELENATVELGLAARHAN
jgi:hypothetical protein